VCLSFVLQYGGCGDDTLEELRTLVPEDTEGLDHPYGLATDVSACLCACSCVQLSSSCNGQ
jgi:hypothetical protein